MSPLLEHKTQEGKTTFPVYFPAIGPPSSSVCNAQQVMGKFCLIVVLSQLMGSWSSGEGVCVCVCVCVCVSRIRHVFQKDSSPGMVENGLDWRNWGKETK